MTDYVIVLMGKLGGLTVDVTAYADNVGRILENNADYIDGVTVIGPDGYALLHYGTRYLSPWNRATAPERLAYDDPLAVIYS